MTDTTPVVATDSTNRYEIKIRILGNEVLAISLLSSDGSNRWVVISLASIFMLTVLLGTYGDNLLRLFKTVTN